TGAVMKNKLTITFIAASIILTLGLFIEMALGQSQTTSGTISNSGQSVNFQNANRATAASFAETFNGSPATATVTISGCFNSTGACTTLDTYSTPTNATRTPSIGTAYDYFLVAAVWTGGSSVSVGVTATMTGGAGQTATSGQPVFMFTS